MWLQRCGVCLSGWSRLSFFFSAKREILFTTIIFSSHLRWDYMLFSGQRLLAFTPEVFITKEEGPYQNSEKTKRFLYKTLQHVANTDGQFLAFLPLHNMLSWQTECLTQADFRRLLVSHWKPSQCLDKNRSSIWTAVKRDEPRPIYIGNSIN